MTALTYAAFYGFESIVQILITAGADVNMATKDEWTALLYATSKGQKETVYMLLNAGANKELKDNGGKNKNTTFPL